jgi:HK97 family phage major capsid protein
MRLQDQFLASGIMGTVGGPNLMQLKADLAHASNKAESLLKASETAGRDMTAAEDSDFNMAMAAVNALTAQIQRKERLSTQRATNQGALLVEGGRSFQMPARKVLTAGYASDFHQWVASRGSIVGEHLPEGADGMGGYVIPGLSAASYEGGATTGAPITPLQVEQQIIELAPAESGVRKLASVIPTVMDLKLPRKTGFGTVALKAESGASSNYFSASDATVESFTLSAFMIGGYHILSWELVQDVNTFQSFAVRDLMLEYGVTEDNLFVNGTGTGQPEGLLGNTGAGVTGVAAGSDSYATELLDATYDVMAKLNVMYWPRSAWLMNRATGLAIRKAQRKANLFDPIWTNVDGVDRLHGFPVEYSAAMPDIGTGATPVLYGSFVDGYVVGDRGGSGLNVKILDQPLATAGQLILLVYRRVDGRIRRSEAIQAITLA